VSARALEAFTPTKVSAAQVCKLLGVREVRLEPIRHTLQQAIARVPPEGIIDDAQVGDIEHGYLKTRQAVSAARQQPTQALAEQRALARPVSGSK